jgi:hypothetical protein
MTTLYILKIQMTQLRTNRDMQSQISRRQTQLSDPIILPDSISTVNSALRSARRRCRQVATEARSLRKTREDERLAAFKLANPDQNPAKLVHQFFRALETKEMFRRLPSMKPKSTGGLSMVKIPGPETANPKTAENWTTITDPIQVEKKILERNQRHFSQASVMPLATPEIHSLLSFGDTSPLADQLLFQNLDPSSITPDYYGQQLLAQCSTDTSEISPDISFEDMKRKYRCWPDRTSTPPSGRHLSHYHALLKPDGINPADADSNNLDSARSAVWSAHHSLLQSSLSDTATASTAGPK